MEVVEPASESGSAGRSWESFLGLKGSTTSTIISFRIGEEVGEEDPEDCTYPSRLFVVVFMLSLGLGEYSIPDFFPVGVSGVVSGVGKPDDIISLISEN